MLEIQALALRRPSRFGGAMRILLVTETLTVGGAETFVVRLANALSMDHEVVIAVMHGEMTNPSLAAHIAATVHVDQLRLPAKRLWFKFDNLLRRIGIDHSLIRSVQRRWLANLIRRHSPDILNSHLIKADRLVTEARAARPDARHIVTLHGDYAPFLSGQSDPQMLNLERRMASIVDETDSIVAICGEHRAFISTRFPPATDKTVLIYNGFAPWRDTHQVTAQVRRQKLVFGMASRGVRLKGWAKAIAAFGRLQPGSAELILIGEGAYLDELRRGPLPAGVRFTGFSPHPVEWINNFDVGLLPSEFPHESLPTAVTEYLFCGKPVIATNVGEIAAMIRTPDGKLAGQLLDFDDRQISTEQLAIAMQSYIDDPELRARHAALAPAAFAKFDMGECAAAYVRLYAEVAGVDASSSSTSESH